MALFSNLTGRDWMALVPFVGTLSFLIFVTARAFIPESSADGKVNLSIQKDCAKVATCLDIEDIGDKAAFCRCWRSKKFPYCDGSHNAHNTSTGDNVGPLVLQKKSA